MFRAARRPLHIALIVLLLAQFTGGCASTQQIPFTAATSLDGITGVTMRSGDAIRFGHRGARITNDTLYAAGPQNEIRLPRDSIAGVSRSKISVGRTIGLVYVLTAAAGLVGWAAAGFPSWSPPY